LLDSLIINELSCTNDTGSILYCYRSPFIIPTGQRFCSLKNSTFTGLIGGGNVGFDGFGRVDIENNKFINNKKPSLGFSNNELNSVFNIKNCLFSQTSSNLGIFDYNELSHLNVTNCIFNKNNSSILSNYFWSEKINQSKLVFNFCTFSNNVATDSLLFSNPNIDTLLFNSCIFTDDDPKPSTLDIGGKYAKFSHCLLSDINGQSWLPLNNPNQEIIFDSTNIFDQKPVFENADSLIFKLATCSSGINKGDLQLSTTLSLSADYEGNPRVENQIPDIGALETPITLLIDSVFGAVNCASNLFGKVTFWGNACQDSLSALWKSNGVAGLGIDNLGAGIYAMTVTEGHGIPFVFDVIVPEISNPITVAVDSIIAASSPTSSTGSILIDAISGGYPPYQLLWSNDTHLEDLLSVPASDYSLGIIDSVGCRTEYDWQVPFTIATNTPDYAFNIALTPNPVAPANVILVNSSVSISKIRIFNLEGRFVTESSFLIPKYSCDVKSPSKSGFYVLKIDFFDGKSTIKRFVVQ
jgi:hypothetical protein